MEIRDDWRGVPAALRGASLALGNFDGVHAGHAAVLAAARGAGGKLGVVTFEPHPREFFRPQDPPFRLTLAAEKADALAALGVDVLFALPFDDFFSHLTADEFCIAVLQDGLGARHVACGADFAFGHRRGGDVSALRRHGFDIHVVPPVSDGEGPISSTRIRRLLQDGYPERAAALLGRPHTIRGIVAHGEARGRTIGFPTANLALGRHVEPARGVYAITARLPDGRVVKGVANIGLRPTVGGTESRLEAHLFDFEGDLYGQEIVVSLLHFLREERKFPSFDALKGQILVDAAAARRLLDAASALRPILPS
jgi:riboflavin kinase/FMN adenylyltransferase